MSIKSREELFNDIKTKIGDSTDDETLALLDDIDDTLSDYEARISDTTDWKTRYEENDKEWRKRYTERFFNKPEDEDKPKDNHEDKPKKLTFEDLFI